MILFWSCISLMIIIALSGLLYPILKPSASAPMAVKNVGLVVFLLCFVPCLTLAIYWYEGRSEQLANWLAVQQQKREVERLRAELGSPKEIIAKLKAHLQQEPDSAQGWYLLGKLYLRSEQLTEAVKALKNAYRLQPHNNAILLSYAESLIITRQYEQADRLLNSLLKGQPNAVQALNLLAFNAFQQGQFKKAEKLWQKILIDYPLAPEDRKAVEELRNSAVSKMER